MPQRNATNVALQTLFHLHMHNNSNNHQESNVTGKERDKEREEESKRREKTDPKNSRSYSFCSWSERIFAVASVNSRLKGK